MKRPSLQEYTEGLLNGNRFMLSRAITLIESQRPSDKQLAIELLQGLPTITAKQSIRIGITGSPGVGKSTFIESFGQYLTSKGKKLAVLAIDPSSQKTGGSILGDKTRMEQLSRNPNAYIRPSAAGATLGGVARKTRESIQLCEVAGFDVIIVETVGVGQSEVMVKEMTDFFLLLMLAGAGDELQGIKKGIMEMTDAMAITKADGENLLNAKRARAEYKNALHLFPPNPSGWIPQVTTCSALENQGMEEVWALIEQFQEQMLAKGWLQSNRAKQRLHWMNDTIREELQRRFYQDPDIAMQLPEVTSQVRKGEMPPHAAALFLLSRFQRDS